MARFFITRPVFAMVIAIVMVILGAVAIPNLPIATYPEVVPPVVQITATYRGGNAQDLERTVAQPIEQQLVGLDGMLYFFSRSSNDGVLTIDVTYDLGTNVDNAAVQTQNRVNLALPQLPPEVQQEGVAVKKVSTAFLLGIAFTSQDDRYDSVFLNNYVTINLLDRISSLPGVGDARVGSRQDYGMRVWLDPAKMATLGLTATDVSAAITAQNRQNPAGSLGQPPVASGTDFQYPVNAAGRLVNADQFGDTARRGEVFRDLTAERDLDPGLRERTDGRPEGVNTLRTGEFGDRDAVPLGGARRRDGSAGVRCRRGDQRCRARTRVAAGARPQPR